MKVGLLRGHKQRALTHTIGLSASLATVQGQGGGMVPERVSTPRTYANLSPLGRSPTIAGKLVKLSVERSSMIASTLTDHR